MTATVTTKPYLIRAIYEWCADCGYTPYLSVVVTEHTRVPMEFVKNGEIVLNVSSSATRNLKIDNDLVQFSARFGGVSREISVPISAVSGIFARENSEGLLFKVGDEIENPADVIPPTDGPKPSTKPTREKSHLKVIK